MSTAPPGRKAATNASGTAITSASTAAIVVSCSVIGSPSRISRATGTCISTESPRFSVTAFTRKSQNCTRREWLSPSSSRNRAMSASDARSPARTSAGSPGSRRMSEKTSKATATTVTAIWPSRRPRTTKRPKPGYRLSIQVLRKMLLPSGICTKSWTVRRIATGYGTSSPNT